MATPPDSPIEEVVYEIEPSRVPKHRPVALEDLCRQTKFTRQEIRVMYRGFKQECPEGVVCEDAFKDIYAKFFPHGNATLYAHYVFKAFDVNCNGAISFRDLLVTLSTLLRGSIYEKLRWTFKLYDINGDGCITRSELGEIVLAIHELMGRRAHQVEEDRKAREQVEYVFRKLDINQDGVITLEEFIESCLKDQGYDAREGRTFKNRFNAERLQLSRHQDVGRPTPKQQHSAAVPPLGSAGSQTVDALFSYLEQRV